MNDIKYVSEDGTEQVLHMTPEMAQAIRDAMTSQAEEKATYWFRQFVAMCDVFGIETPAGADWNYKIGDDLIRQAFAASQNSGKLQRIRELIMAKQGHKMERNTWERDLLNEIQAELKIKVLL